MNQREQLTIKEFAKLTGIKRENLRYYDRIGLLSPETRGENNYRYYSRHQLNPAYLIISLRGLGVSIEDIKQYTDQCTPEKTLSLFAQQEAQIQEEIRQLQETSLVIRIHSNMVQEALAHEENALFIEEKEQEPIYLCPPVPPEMDSDEGIVFAYEYAGANGVNMGFPQGTLIAQKQMELLDPSIPDRYYFKVGLGGNAYKPAGKYAVAYGRCDPWKSEVLYRRLILYIQEQNYSICGDAYEEYLINDIADQNMNLWCLRIEVPITANR